jgi:NAD(P)H-flavin reductase
MRLGAPVGVSLTAYTNHRRDLLLIGGGTGLAPLRAITEHLAMAGDTRQVTVVAGATSADELYDLPALAALEATMPSLTVIPAVAHGPLSGAQSGTAAHVALRQQDWSSHDIYICGSPTMLTATSGAFIAAGYRSEQIITERFDYRERRTIRNCAEKGTVTRP